MTERYFGIGKLIYQMKEELIQVYMPAVDEICRRFYPVYPEIVAEYIMLYRKLYEDTE